jgi:hypothetical protein
LRKCWKCGKEGNYKKDCKSKKVDKLKGYDNVSSTEVKSSTKEGGDCWVCVIFFARVVVSECLHRARRGVRWGASRPLLRGCRGEAPLEKKFLPRETCHVFRWFFWHMVFANGFLFPVKELGFWTNPGHWVRVLDADGSYMYIVL